MLACGCASKAPPPDVIGASRAEAPRGAVEYAFDSLDDMPVSSRALVGKPTVIAFFATYDLPSLAQVDYLAEMAKNDRDRIHYALVALDRPEDRELVEAFRRFVEEKSGVLFAVAMADRDTISGAGPFGDVHVVPTVVILDRAGKLSWQRSGLSKSDEIRAAMRGL